MLIQEILNSYNPDKVKELKTSDTRFYRKVVLDTGDVLTFDADATAYDLTSGDYIWEIVFRVNDSYIVGAGNGKAVNEVFSFVLRFLDELKNNGAKAFYFTADKDHQKLYNALVKRFARGMNVENLGDFYHHYFITTDDFELGFSSHRKGDDVIISIPKPFEIDFERRGAVIEVSGGTYDSLQTLNDRFPNTIGAIGNLLTQDSNYSQYVIQGDYDTSEISNMLDIYVLEEPTIITTYMSKTTGSWVYEYFDGEELNDGTADSNTEGLWELYLGNVPETLQPELLENFINEVKPDVFFVDGIEYDADIENYTVYPEENGVFCVIRNYHEVPLEIKQEGETDITLRAYLGDHSFKFRAMIKDNVIRLSSSYHASDNTIEELLRNDSINRQITKVIDSLVEKVDEVEFDVYDLGSAFQYVFGDEYDF